MSVTMLSRVELQQLAKQHGIKANMKNAEIEAALLERGVELAGAPKKKGLSVRDPNAQEEAAITAKNTKAKPVAAKTKAPNDEEPTSTVDENEPSRRSSRTSKTQESSQQVPAELPLAARRTRRSAGTDTGGEEQVLEELPIAQRRSRRSASLAGSKPEESVEALVVKRTSRSRESLKAEVSEDQTMQEIVGPVAIQGSMEDLEEKPFSVVDETNDVDCHEASNDNVETNQPRLSVGGRYSSKRRSSQRGAVLAEIDAEMKVKMPVEAEIVASEMKVETPLEAEVMASEMKVEETEVMDSEMKVEEAEVMASETKVEMPLEGHAMASETKETLQEKQEEQPSTEIKVVQTVEEDVHKENLVPQDATVTVSAESKARIADSPIIVQQNEGVTSGTKRILGNALRVIRKVAVPDLPPTPSDKSEMEERSEPSAGMSSSIKAPESQAVETSVPLASEKPKPKLSFGRRIAVPLLPATPEDVRKERERNDMERAEKMEKMRTKVKGALEALDDLHGHLVEQKRLYEALQATRLENKRLREALQLDG